MTCIMDRELGAYVLHALEPQEADAVSRHLTGCPACRDEVRSLSSTASLLALVTLQDVEGLSDLQDVDDEGAALRTATAPAQSAVARPNSCRPARPRRRPAALAVAAAVLTASASVGAVRVLGGDHGSSNPSVVQVVDPATHVQAAVTMTSRGSGTQLRLTLAGAYPSGACSLVARASDGRSDTAATWVADTHGAADVAGATAIPASQLRELDVVTDTGQTLVQINLHRYSK
jgi:anti-sigma factor RsiW